MSGLPPHRHGGGRDRPDRTIRLTWRRFASLALGLAVLALGAGILFGRADPQRAARVVVSEFTTVEDGEADTPGPDPATPVTGPQRGTPVCGLRDGPLTPEEQVRTVAAGVVVVQHRDDAPDALRERLTALADRDRVVVAPNADLPDGAVLVVTSWRHRMVLDRPDTDLAATFVTGHADRAPALEDCP